MFERERRIVNGKIHSILHVTPFILKDENETSMKVFQEAMIHSCVEVVVRETKRQCRILRISVGHNTSVRIKDEVSLLNWIPHFAVKLLNKRRIDRRWRKLMVQFGEDVVSKDWRRRYQLNIETKESRNLRWSPGSKENNFVYCQEWRFARPHLDTTDPE